jgi:hypothetical protein
MKRVVARMELVAIPDRQYRISAQRNVSFIYSFSGQDMKLGALAVSPAGVDFAPGTTQDEVQLDFWADDEWTTVVQPGSTFVVWYGGDVGSGVVLRER